jgi:hypothetical protein
MNSFRSNIIFVCPCPSILNAMFGKSFPRFSNRRENVFCSCFGLNSRNVKW